MTSELCPATHPRCQHTRAADYYAYSCRCPAARADRERRRKTAHILPDLIDSTGLRRRLQALMAIGWPSRELAHQLGRRSGAIGPLLWGAHQHKRVTRRLDQQVKDLYDRLWETPGPSKETARRAKNNGWPPPLWWDDDVIDDPTYQDHTTYQLDQSTNTQHTWFTHDPEFLERVQHLTRAGRSAADIATQLRVTPRTVQRARARLRAQEDVTQASRTLTAMQEAS